MGVVKAVFIDVLGTLVELEPPWIALREVVGPGIEEEKLVRAVKIEMGYYKEHSHEGRDEASLADLRERCAALLSKELGAEVSVDQLVEAIRFDAYPDALPALRGLRERGVKTIAVSNWDCSLERVLERCGLGGELDGTVSSASVGKLKPDPAIFAAALELAGCSAEEALHVGDTPEEDGVGAAAAGIRALIIDRKGGADIETLGEIEARL